MKQDAKLKELKAHGTPQYAFELFQYSEKNADLFVTNHWHDDLEIIYVVSGTLNISINNNSFVGSSGDIFFVNKGEMHEMYGKSTSLNYFAFIFDAAFLSFMAEDAAQKQFLTPIINDKIHFPNYIKSNSFMAETLKRIFKLNTKLPEAYMLGTKAGLLQFFCELLNKGLYTFEKADASSESKSLLLKGIISYINDSYQEQIPLSDIAQEFSMSPKYFCRFFKNNFNKTFIEYVNNVRVEHAMELLKDRHASVTETALSCGFSNMSYFTRTFKKASGYTPSEYRKNIFNDQ